MPPKAYQLTTQCTSTRTDSGVLDKIGARARKTGRRNSCPCSRECLRRSPRAGAGGFAPALLMSTVTSDTAGSAASMNPGSVMSSARVTTCLSGQTRGVRAVAHTLAAPQARAAVTNSVPMPRSPQ